MALIEDKISTNEYHWMMTKIWDLQFEHPSLTAVYEEHISSQLQEQKQKHNKDLIQSPSITLDP
jgi:hypothetical protein